MQKVTTLRSGDLVDLFDEGGLVSAVVLGEEKGRLRVVTESGKELRVPSARVVHRAGSAPTSASYADHARQHAGAARARLSDVDLPALWDVLADEPRRMSLEALAELALGDEAPVARSAMLRALVSDHTYFSRKADAFEPRSRDHVLETLKREDAERSRAQRREAFLQAARAAVASPGSQAAPALDRSAASEHVADLVELALMGDEAPSRKQAVALLDDAGLPGGASAERAFRLLEALGVFGHDENLFVHRFHLRTVFSPEVERAASQAALAPPDEARRDLRGLCAFTVDDAGTTELDDAISLDVDGGALALGIHIADPSGFVRPGDLLDREAMSRAATFYFPDLKLPMLPAAISEGAASLASGVDRPALSFLVTLSPLGEVLRSEIAVSMIRSRARLTYDQADEVLAGGEVHRPPGDASLCEEIATALQRLRALAEALEAERVNAGAIIVRAAEVSVRVGPGGAIDIARVDQRGPARRVVAEMMILANRLAAEYCVRRGIAAIFRRQAPPTPADPSAASSLRQTESPPALAGYDPVAVRALRRRMRRGEVGLAPGPHAGLGLSAYTQATSPIRRYQDLAVHRQIKASLLGRPHPYDAEALARIAATTEEAEKIAREAERGTSEYWILKYYEGRIGRQVEGVVVEAGARRTEVELEDTLYVASIAPRPDHRPGLRLRLIIESAMPRGRRLVLAESRP